MGKSRSSPDPSRTIFFNGGVFLTIWRNCIAHGGGAPPRDAMLLTQGIP